MNEYNVSCVGGVRRCPIYYVTVELCRSGIVFESIEAASDDELPNDFIIGMNIIESGDFAFTNNKEHFFSFRVPSRSRIDFTQ